MKKQFSLILAGLLLASCCAGCGNDNGKNNSGQGSDGGKTVIRVLSSQGQGEFPEGSDENNNIFVDYLREQTPYDYEFTFFKEIEDRNALIASGQKFDIIKLQGAVAADMMKLQKQNYLTPVDEFLPDAANITNVEQTPQTAWNSCKIDGTTYAIPCCWSEVYFSAMVRTDWLEKLNLPMPKTKEDFKQMLIAFRDQDPDGNQANDTIPLSANALGGLMTLFRAMWDIQGEYMDIDGKVTYTYATDTAKEMIAYAADLYQEGLIDPEFGNITQDLITQRVVNNQIGCVIGAWWDMKGWETTFAEQGTTPMPMNWMELPDNVNGAPSKVQPSGPIENTFIFPAGGNTKQAVDFLNTVLKPDVAETLQFGFKDQHWTKDASGVRTLTEAYNDVIYRWHYADGLMFNHDMMEESENLEYGKYRNPVQAYSGGEAAWSLQLPPIEGIDQNQLNISEHSELELTKFIMGDRPLDQWENYVSELDGLGLNDVLAKMQQAHDQQ